MLKCLKFQQAFFCCPEKSGIVKGRGKRRWIQTGQSGPGHPLNPLATLSFMPSKAQMQKSRSYAQLHAKSKVLWVRTHTNTFKCNSCVFVCVSSSIFFFEMSCIYTLSLSLRLYAFLRLLFALVRNLICVFVLRFSFGCRPKKGKSCIPRFSSFPVGSPWNELFGRCK